MNTDIDATRQPIISLHDGGAWTTSLDVSAFFGKQHSDVLRSIRNLLEKEPALGLRNFASFKNNDLTGEHTAYYEMDRDGFTLLAMGFTGTKALKWKLRYIEAFNAMEAELRRQSAKIDVRDPSQLSAIAIQLIEVNKELEARAATAEAQVEAAKPKTLFFDQFANADGLYGLQNAARVLGESPNKFVGRLKQGYLFYQGGALVPKVQYREMGIFEVKCTIVDDKARYQTYVTPKGLQYLARIFGKDDLFSQVA